LIKRYTKPSTSIQDLTKILSYVTSRQSSLKPNLKQISKEHDKNVVKESEIEEIPPENKEDKGCEEFEQSNKTQKTETKAQETQKEIKDEKLPFETISLKNLQNGFANASGSTCYIGCVLHVNFFFPFHKHHSK